MEKEVVKAIDNDFINIVPTESVHRMDNRRFWTSDYPVLCYPSSYDGTHGDSNCRSLVMTHLADSKADKKVIPLENKFLGFVDIFAES